MTALDIIVFFILGPSILFLIGYMIYRMIEGAGEMLGMILTLPLAVHMPDDKKITKKELDDMTEDELIEESEKVIAEKAKMSAEERIQELVDRGLIHEDGSINREYFKNEV